jgi:hypothetical protein
MLDTGWSDSWRGAFRIELRAEAVGLAARGWPVMPGTYPAGPRWAGREGVNSTGPVPVSENWQERVGIEPEEVAAWWTDRSHTLLVATGRNLDAIEVGAELGRKAACVLRTFGMPVPIIATPNGKWLFLTATGGELRDVLVSDERVILHGLGSWVPLPPSPYEHGVVHWRVKPEVCGWRLPDTHAVQEAIVDALAVEKSGSLAAAKVMVAD